MSTHASVHGMRQLVVLHAQRRQIVGIVGVSQAESLGVMNFFRRLGAAGNGALLAVFLVKDAAHFNRHISRIRRFQSASYFFFFSLNLFFPLLQKLQEKSIHILSLSVELVEFLNYLSGQLKSLHVQTFWVK